MTDLLITINLPTLILILITLLAIGVCFFLLGYLYQAKQSVGVYNPIKNQSTKILNHNISIDDTKIVTKIQTDNLEKKYDSLGDKKETQENILESVNKLKNLKK